MMRLHMNEKPPKISVLGASYNHEQFLLQALQSILSQQGPSFELILIDDASADGTQDIIKRISDPRVRAIMHETNQGICRTFNEAFSHSRGEYIAFMSGDDVFMPNKLAIQAAYLDAHPDAVAVFSLMTPIDSAGWPIRDLMNTYLQYPGSREDILRRAFFGYNCLFAPTEMLRREIIASEPYFHDIRCGQAHDWEQHVRMALKGNIAVIPEPLVKYRIHDNNASKPSDEVNARLTLEHEIVLNSLLRLDDPRLLFRMFPEIAHMENVTAEKIPFLLALTAIIGTKSIRLKQWGMRVLSDFLSTEAKARHLEELTGFTLKEYYKLQAETGGLPR